MNYQQKLDIERMFKKKERDRKKKIKTWDNYYFSASRFFVLIQLSLLIRVDYCV